MTNMPVYRFCVHQIYQDVYDIGKKWLSMQLFRLTIWCEAKSSTPSFFIGHFCVFISSLTSLLTIFYTRNQQHGFQTWAVLRKKKKVCFWSCVAPQVFVHVGSNNSVNCMAFILFIGHYYSYVSAFGELYGLRRSPQCQRYKSTSSSCCQLLAQHPALPLVKT